jgi:glutamate N-acetyltransferase/amino-acid N-acetyltransferase
MMRIEGHIATPKGFRAGGIHCGLKKNTVRDLGAIVCETTAQAAAVYTTNVVQAAPLHVTKQAIAREGKLRTVLVNSGNANACTGKKGQEDAVAMQTMWAKQCRCAPHHVAIASTGVIGVLLPMPVVSQGIERLSAHVSMTGGHAFTEAIMTTDTRLKSCCVTVAIDGQTVTIAGVAKGSGMIHPHMATMLAFMTTDASIADGSLAPLLQAVTEDTFNMVTVDGDTSTNDMVIALASGHVHHDMLHPAHPQWSVFVAAFRKVATHLAQEIARDGEGATKRIAAHVRGAFTDAEARQIAKTIVGSNLVKSAIFGTDANWGRILAAAGRAGVTFDPEAVTISLGSIAVLQDGTPVSFDEAGAKAYLEQEEIDIHVTLGNTNAAIQGGVATAWGCDLTYDYVKINASYRS